MTVVEQHLTLDRYEAYLRQRKRAQEEDASFPDEVDTPRHIAARTRFQRYRGLRSFRTSPWDPYENLPLEYGEIFQFENFSATQKRVIREAMDEGIEVSPLADICANRTGWYTRCPCYPRRTSPSCHP